jgi:hypothetical protein
MALRWTSKESMACRRPPGKQIRLTSWRSAESAMLGQMIRLAPVCRLASRKPTVARLFDAFLRLSGISSIKRLASGCLKFTMVFLTRRSIK